MKYLFLVGALLVSVCGWGQQQQAWEWQYPNKTGQFLYDVYFQDTATGFMVGTYGLIGRTSDGGKTWNYFYEPGLHTLRSLCFPDRKHGWVGGSGTGALVSPDSGIIMHTADGGMNWTKQHTGIVDNIGSVFFLDSATGWASTRRGNMIHTTNGGLTWSAPISQFPFATKLHFITKRLGWAVGGYGGVYKTRDGGATWIGQNTGSAAWINGDFNAITVVDSNNIIVSADNNILRTRNGGTTWTILPSAPNQTSAVTYFQDGNNGWAADHTKILRTRDGGRTWNAGFTYTPTRSQTAVYGLHMFDGRIGWAVGLAGGIWKTVDSGATWVSLTGPTPSRYYEKTFRSASFVDKLNGWVASDSGLILHTADGGQSWDYQSLATVPIASVFFHDRLNGWANYYQGMVKTTNGGLSWTNVAADPAAIQVLSKMVFVNPRKGYGLQYPNYVSKTTDGGATWTRTILGASVGTMTLYSLQFPDSLTGYAGGHGPTYKTVDGGLTWTDLGPMVDTVLNMSFVSPDTGWINANGKILRTTDGGATWEFCIRMTREANIKFIHGNMGIVAEEPKSAYTRDGGRTWTPLTFPSFSQDVLSLSLTDDLNAWAVGYFSSILHITLPGGLPPGPVNKKQITGFIYERQDTNCIRNANESPIVSNIIKADPGPFYGITDFQGHYRVSVDSGSYTVSQLLRNEKNLIQRQHCPDSSHSIDFATISGDTAKNLDFANEVTRCSFLTASVGSDRRRRCFRNYTTLTYCNQGYASASNVVAHVKLPNYVNLISANLPYTFNPSDSSYEFTIGTLAAGHCGTIHITDSVSCTSDARGSEQCTRAWLTPGNPLAPSGCVPKPAGYDGSDISIINLRCQGPQLSVPVFSIRNHGDAMSAARQYRVYLDSILVYSHSYQLAAGDSIVFFVQRTLTQWQQGMRVRVEAEQDAANPYSHLASAIDECFLTMPRPQGSDAEGGYFPQDDESPVVDIDCQTVRDSYDPNDKAVSPHGVSTSGNVRPGTMLDYTIRFQNTGNDTAYVVRVEDTLSADLDLATLELGASSHPYAFSVGGKGRPALMFTFPRINLVDSVTNELASHGFISFRIRPKSSAPIGTRIENQASIYFDFNDPVVTNSTLNTIYVPTVVPGLIDSVVVTAIKPAAVLPTVTIQPNPSQGRFSITTSASVQVEVQSLQGQRLLSIPAFRGSKDLNLSRYGAGMYLLSISSDTGREVRKVVVE